MRSRHSSLVLFATLSFGTVTTPSSAQSSGPWSLRAGVLHAETAGQLRDSGRYGVDVRSTIDDGSGIGIALRWLPRSVGLEFWTARVTADVESVIHEFRPPELPQIPERLESGRFELRPQILSMPICVKQADALAVYLGPSVGQLRYSTEGALPDRSAEWSWGALIGLTHGLGSNGRWAVDAQARYLAAETDDTVDEAWRRLRFLQLDAGVVFRFRAARSGAR